MTIHFWAPGWPYPSKTLCGRKLQLTSSHGLVCRSCYKARQRGRPSIEIRTGVRCLACYDTGQIKRHPGPRGIDYTVERCGCQVSRK